MRALAEQPARITIFTGNSCPAGHGDGAWAAIVVAGTCRQELSGAERATTNDRLELQAAIAGISAAPAGGDCWLVTRNQNLYQALLGRLAGWQRHGWRTAAGHPLKNRDLWEQLHALTGTRPVSATLSRGHVGPTLTEAAHRLATRAAQPAGRRSSSAAD